jgi:hypothetical protein
MNYEVFYQEYLTVANQLHDQQKTQQKLLKRIDKSVEKGDLRNVLKDLVALNESVDAGTAISDDLYKVLSSVNLEEYLSRGDFANQLIEYCKQRDVDIVGEDRNFEVFPYRLKINPIEEELLINKKKAPGLRPIVIAELLEKNRDKLLAEKFNSEKYAAELAAAYDLSIIAGAKGKTPVPDADVYLSTVYKYLTPMQRFRKDYDLQSFAFDIARLYNAEQSDAGDGRKYQFGPSRNNARAIRIVDKFGNEQFIATIRFYQD